MQLRYLLLTSLCLAPLTVFAESVKVPVHLVDEHGIGKDIGTITLSDTAKGLLVSPQLIGLFPGVHGFHIHEKPSCDPADKDGKMTAAQGAGGHFDPAHTGKHAGPTGDGHQGDLAALTVASDGSAKTEVTIARLDVKSILGRSLMIHEGGDNYSDTPQPLGGGGKRVACGVIPTAASK